MQANMRMFFVAVVLPEPINEKVLHYKTWMLEQYRCRVGLKSPAHITLIAPFWTNAAKEAEIIQATDRLSAAFQPFDLATCDFSAFEPRTIFIALEESRKLQELKACADSIFTSIPDLGVKKENRPFHPHITIATRDLYKKDFHEVWPRFASKTFRESWTAKGVSVLRHNTKNWDVIHTARFRTTLA